MSNQRQRWGSATYATAQIRISSELQGVPGVCAGFGGAPRVVPSAAAESCAHLPHSGGPLPAASAGAGLPGGYALGRSRAEGKHAEGERGENSAG